MKVTPEFVRALRGHHTQHQFAAMIGIPIETLRNWEQGKRTPRDAALVLLQLIAREPEACFRALKIIAPAAAAERQFKAIEERLCSSM